MDGQTETLGDVVLHYELFLSCILPQPRAGALSSKNDVDTFTFRYPSVEVCTTSVC